MSQRVIQASNYKQITSTTNVTGGANPGPVHLAGIFVSSASNTPTITVYDEVAAGTTTKLVDTFTPTVGWFPLPFKANTGLNVVIGGTVSCTVAWEGV